MLALSPYRHAAAAVLTAALVCVAGCQKGNEPAAEAQKPDAAGPPSVGVVPAQQMTWPSTIRVQGTLNGYERSVVGTKIEGRVEAVEVDLGSKVSRGQPLLLLDSRDLELRVRQAEAQLAQVRAAVGLEPDEPESELNPEQSPPVLLERALLNEAESAYGRGQQLRTRNAISPEELSQLEAQWRAAEARYKSALNRVGEQIALIGVRRVELALAEQQLADSRIVAPFDGIVQRRHVDTGEYLQAGDATMTLIRTDRLRFTAGVPERVARSVRKGQSVRIFLDGEPDPITATVSRVSPGVDPAGRALWIQADVPNQELKLRTGLFAEADIVVDEAAQALVVPSTALTEFAGIEKVWLVRDGEAVEQTVRIGRRDGRRVEILEGLKPGATVIADSDEGQPGAVAAVEGQPAWGAQVAGPSGVAE